MENNKIKAFVFDFDNTLLASDELVGISFFYGYKKVMGKDVTLKEIVKCYGPEEAGVFYGLIKDETKAKEAYKYYLEKYEELQKELFKDGFDKKYLNILKKIKDNGFKLLLLTGRSLKSTEISLDYFGLSDLFEKIYSGSFYGVNKPDNLRKLMNDYALNNDEIVYFGDTLNDIKSCNEVNVNCASFGVYVSDKNKEELKKNNSYKYIGTLDDLSNFIDEAITLK